MREIELPEDMFGWYTDDYEDAQELQYQDKQRTKGYRKARRERREAEAKRKESLNVQPM